MGVGITLRVLDGADRGRSYAELHTPVTIGREEGNTIQLNDERVSRFHLKIQEDHDRLVLTDLESTNGTKVNGEDIQLKILRVGDIINVGRSVLLYGTREQIAERLAQLHGNEEFAHRGTLGPGSKEERKSGQSSSFDLEPGWPLDPDSQAYLMLVDPPELPDRLSPGQAAQCAELFEYFIIRMRHLLASVRSDAKSERVSLDYAQWQSVVDLQSRLGELLRAVTDPDRS